MDGVGSMRDVLRSKFEEKPRLKYFGVPKTPWWAESFGAHRTRLPAAFGKFLAGGNSSAHHHASDDQHDGSRGLQAFWGHDRYGVTGLSAEAVRPVLQEGVDWLEERSLWAQYGVH